MNCKKIAAFFLILILPLNFVACSFNTQKSNEKQLNMYIGVKDKESLNTIKILTDEYRKNNPDVKININNIIGNKVDDNIINGTDIVFINRSDLLNLAPKGLISDMKNYYKEDNITNRYYSVVKAYGRFNDKYYGIPIIPYNLEFLYNKKYFTEANIKAPMTMGQFENILKTFNNSSKKIPVLLNEDMDINSAVFSLLGSKKSISMINLENIYGSNKEKYEKLKYMQDIFSDINNLVRNKVINKNTFEIGNESTLEKFNRGEIPMILLSSYYIKDIKSQDVYSIYENMKNIKVPVVSNTLISIPTNASNVEAISDFIKFVFGDNMQNKLLKMGYITGNKKINSKNTGIRQIVSSHIKNSTDDNISIVYNIPKKIVSSISSKIDDILSGKYTGNEWKDIINNDY
ncbi:MAG: ABC transporter substrate-binding protein [Clostridium tyrobutyricum]|jgi:ABC-type glycerol-3-phosphate transport system substrate-binding protein|uniref:ABC transporter substrate-binding protein n=2 Tax=Clostridium tyrobutyricum TaxID=1519 RepID=UPI00057F7106|nr:ABC transporter substrate-binding protein [Clostridium tyrobutyricum]MBR9647987.1 carbohydrate ABC transporter substrate-binding protein [Clostridium tyrobutyricum]MBV4416403.1 ABC transporter substrate-binding protein [Clostridium tyrobutyricum]MBV4422526.1 ABC transporter substrate-binding protein [Clostridium tyrobutyricum]MBV4430217.1 ABC transporter substrate-binding protein [Clostridium tyrobutyricum]MBV4438070.1 ABC transporter substrate-binding protein [Clostridium tyrobutyricum]